MRKDDDERWTEDVDVDRVRASPRSIAGGWAVVAMLGVAMLIGPPTIRAADVALMDAEQDVAKVELRVAQVLPRSMFECGHRS